MLIDTHIHIGDRNECQYIVDNSIYRNIYRLYSCIKPEVISLTNEFLMDVDKYFAIPLFFFETDIDDANIKLLNKIKGDSRAIPVLLLPKNESISRTQEIMKYKILKEHFSLHSPKDISDRDDAYDYLSQIGGILLLHTLEDYTLSHIKYLRKEFPNMHILLAHLGRNSHCDYIFTKNIIESLCSDDKIITDISTVDNELLIRYAINKYGKERVLYGSDFPFETDAENREKNFMKMALRASLSDDEKEHLFYKNAERVIQYAKIKRR